MRLMYDSTTASDIPVDAALVGGYIDGIYRWSDAGWARFPNAVKVRIAIHATTHDGDVLDVEWGAAAPDEVPSWVAERRAVGEDPSVYVNRSNWQACRDACFAASVAEPHWWLASYDNDPTIPDGCVAKQYANEPLTGGHYDLSVVADYWPGVDSMYVTLEAFENYKIALEKELNEQYLRKDDPQLLEYSRHHHESLPTVVVTQGPK